MNLFNVLDGLYKGEQEYITLSVRCKLTGSSFQGTFFSEDILLSETELSIFKDDIIYYVPISKDVELKKDNADFENTYIYTSKNYEIFITLF